MSRSNGVTFAGFAGFGVRLLVVVGGFGAAFALSRISCFCVMIGRNLGSFLNFNGVGIGVAFSFRRRV